MAIAAATQTFRNAVKPVGEVIELSVHSHPGATATAHWQYDYDYEIDANYVVSDLEVTKTELVMVAGTILDVRVYRVPAGTDAAVTLTTADEIAKCGMAASTALGTKVKAGVLTTTVQPTIAVGVISAAGVTTPSSSTELLAGSTNASTTVNGVIVYNNTVMPIAAVAPVSVGGLTKQRIRIIVSGTAAAAAETDFSCFVRVSLCRFSDFSLLQTGAAGRDNGELAISAP